VNLIQIVLSYNDAVYVHVAHLVVVYFKLDRTSADLRKSKISHFSD